MRSARVLLLCTALLAAVGLLAACGGSGSPAASAPAASGVSGTSGASGATNEAYIACLREHGVEVPDGFGAARPDGVSGATGAPGGASGAIGQRPRVSGATGESGDAGGLRNNPAFAEAMQACASLAPAGGGLGGANGAGSAAFDAYASCMKDHGVEVGSGLRGGASGATGATGSSGTPPTTVNRDDPAFIAANQVCEALLPARNVPGATTTTVQP